MRLCGAVPVLDFLSSLTLGVAVALLDLSFELGAAPAYGGQIVVGKLAPPLLGPAPQLLPVSFKSIPIYLNLLVHMNLLSFCNLLFGLAIARHLKRRSRNCRGTRLVALTEVNSGTFRRRLPLVAPWRNRLPTRCMDGRGEAHRKQHRQAANATRQA